MNDDFDQEAINSIKELMADEFIGVAETYIKNAKRHVRVIQNGVDRKDAPMIVKSAHPLKSSSAMMGMIKVSDLSKQIELLAKSGVNDFSKGSVVGDLVAELLVCFEVGLQKLNDEMEAHNT